MKMQNVINKMKYLRKFESHNLEHIQIYPELFESMVFKFEEFILEKSIGSEGIRLKHYADIPKKTFYKLVNIDPTSVRKKEFSKPGKYTKWLLREYKNGNFIDLDDEKWVKDLKKYLFIFSTGWFKSKVKKRSKVNEEYIFKTFEGDGIDILKYDIHEFLRLIYEYVGAYEKETEKGKYDVVYSDDKISVLVPLNFSASYETAKNTEWCSQSLAGFSSFSQSAILFRIIPKDNKFDRLKLTWFRVDSRWQMACSKYPEISGGGNPFDVIDGVENWKGVKNIADDKVNPYQKWVENSRKIDETMGLVSSEAKKFITEYYKKYSK